MIEKQFDVAIIGGGIQGAGIAVALAHAGLNVFLCEKNDFASATSSASTKLIHGGLRYLEYGEFRLVKEALHERTTLMNIAPHLVGPLQFIMPVNQSIRKKWLLRIGFFFYDIFCGKTLIAKSTLLHRSNSAFFSYLQSQLVDAFSYYDCWTSDSRLTIENILLAQQLGAVAVNYHECVAAEKTNHDWKLQIKHNASNDYFSVRAKCVVNATGPWTSDVAKHILKLTDIPKIKLIKGSHIIIKKKFDGDVAYTLQNNDGRIVFVVPFENNFQLIGTTDVEVESVDNKLAITEQEKNYLCTSFNRYFNVEISDQDIVSSFSGVRTLQYDPNKKASEISRDYAITITDPQTPVVSIVGGKLTTYRVVSAKIAKQLLALFPKHPYKSTKKLKLPGNQFSGLSFHAFIEQLKSTYHWLPSPITERLAKTYGSRAELILQHKHAISDLGKHFGHGLYQAEVEFLIQYEFVKHVDDILWRRTKLGLWFTEDQKQELASFL